MPYINLTVEELELLEQAWPALSAPRRPVEAELRDRLRSELAYQRIRDPEAETESVRRRIGVAPVVEGSG